MNYYIGALFFIGIVLFCISCSNHQDEPISNNLIEDSKDYININQWYNEMLDLDSVKIKGQLKVITTVDSAKMVFGDIIKEYIDYRFPYWYRYDSSYMTPIKIYVFKSAIFRQWRNKIILMKMDFNNNNFITTPDFNISASTPSSLLPDNFPLSTRLALAYERNSRTGGSANSAIVEIRVSEKYEYHRFRWNFIIQSEKFMSLELYNTMN